MDPAAPSDPAEFATAHAAVCALCDHFDAERVHFIGADYKEAEARVQFITPFFRALGWDVDNAAHRSVYEKEVVIEKRQDVAGHALIYERFLGNVIVSRNKAAVVEPQPEVRCSLSPDHLPARFSSYNLAPRSLAV